MLLYEKNYSSLDRSILRVGVCCVLVPSTRTHLCVVPGIYTVGLSKFIPL